MKLRNHGGWSVSRSATLNETENRGRKVVVHRITFIWFVILRPQAEESCLTGYGAEILRLRSAPSQNDILHLYGMASD